MILAAATDVGMHREENQDMFVYKAVSDNIAYAVVCDGMGGANGGRIASQTACEIISEIFDQFFETEQPPYDLALLFRRSIRMANEKIYQMSKENDDLAGMGTTVVAAIVVNNDLFVANVGDSRAYLFFGNSVQQISVDHSAVQELVELGQITSDQAKSHPGKNIITRALGVDSMIEFDYFTYNLFVGDTVLLCSDGLSNYCSDEYLCTVINSSENLQDIADDLISYANACGGRDNITALLIKQDC